ncbi:Arginine kinase [Dirofilaria immitis]|nr:Arginine kinase [Dirofilaria immitis]
MSLPGTFKNLFAVAGGATAAVLAVTYTGELYKMNYQIDEADAFLIRKVNTAYAELQKTKLGASLYDIIRSGLLSHDLATGVYAADPESYHKFAILFDKILEDYHGFKPGAKQPAVDFGEEKISELPSLDPTGKYIKSVRIRCARSIAGYPFNPLLCADDYMILEQKVGFICLDYIFRVIGLLVHEVKNALLQIEESELRGIYYSLDEMPKKTQDELDNKQLLFSNNNWAWSLLQQRQIFLVWINEEEHVSIISTDEGSNVGKVLARLIRGTGKNLTFARDNRLGWLTSNPINLGSAVSASVQIRLPKLSKKSDFMEICEKLNLHVSSANINSSGVRNEYYFISNKLKLVDLYNLGIKNMLQLDCVAGPHHWRKRKSGSSILRCYIDTNYYIWSHRHESFSMFVRHRRIGMRWTTYRLIDVFTHWSFYLIVSLYMVEIKMVQIDLAVIVAISQLTSKLRNSEQPNYCRKKCSARSVGGIISRVILVHPLSEHYLRALNQCLPYVSGRCRRKPKDVAVCKQGCQKLQRNQQAEDCQSIVGRYIGGQLKERSPEGLIKRAFWSCEEQEWRGNSVQQFSATVQHKSIVAAIWKTI